MERITAKQATYLAINISVGTEINEYGNCCVVVTSLDFDDDGRLDASTPVWDGPSHNLTDRIDDIDPEVALSDDIAVAKAWVEQRLGHACDWTAPDQRIEDPYGGWTVMKTQA